MSDRNNRYVIMWSGGKDSCLALWRARKFGTEVTAAINFYDANTSRVRFHALRTEVIAAQIRSLGLDLIQVGTLPNNYDSIASTTLQAARGRGFKGAVFGNIHLQDVYASSAALCHTANLAHIEPLWGSDPVHLLEEFVDSGFRALITCCQLDRLDETWLGRRIDQTFVQDMRSLSNVDACGENGEYHSCVIEGPLFTRHVPVIAGQIRRSAEYAQLDLTLQCN
jgi:uncharacterized protein (TIGR00290 family)